MGNIENTKSSDALSFNALNSGVLILFCLLSGCALFPPPPAECTGQFKPVNASVETDTAINQPAVEANSDSKAVEPDKTLQSEEITTDGK